MSTQVSARTGAQRNLLALACDVAGDAMLVAELPEDGAPRCLAANRRFTERFGGGADVAGQGLGELFPAGTACALASAAHAARRDDRTVVVGEPITDLEDDAFEVRATVVVDADGGGRVVVWTMTEPGPGSEGAGVTGVLGLAEANRHLRAENRELTRSNLDLDQFAYVASHDLVEPLRMVTAYLDLLSERYGDALDDQAKRYIGFAVDGATRMRALVDDLLTLARLSSSDGQLEDVDLRVMLERVTTDLRLRIEETGASVTSGPLPVVHGDAGQLMHAMANLVANAIRFRRTDVAPVITVSAERTDGGWRVTVADNGIGIKPEFRSQVFDMFRRLHPRSAYPGTGMGLAIAKKVVERHGGSVGVEATADGGSAFWFTLPHAAEATQPTPRQR